MSLVPCLSCHRLVREDRCPFCARRGALATLGAAVLVLAAACEPKTQDVVVDPTPTSTPSTTAAASASALPTATATPVPTASATATASAAPTASATASTKKDRPVPTVTSRPIQTLYGGPPPPLEDEIV